MAKSDESEAERLKKLKELAQRSKKFGSMSDVLTPEFLERPRDISVEVVLPKNVLSQEEMIRMSRSMYGINPRGPSSLEKLEAYEKMLNTPFGL